MGASIDDSTPSPSSDPVSLLPCKALSLDVSSGVSDHATKLVDDYISKGGTLEHLEALLARHAHLAHHSMEYQRQNNRDASADYMRQFWRATGFTPITLKPLLQEIRKRKDTSSD